MDKYETFGQQLKAVHDRFVDANPGLEASSYQMNLGAWAAVAKAVDVQQQVDRFHAEGHGLTGSVRMTETGAIVHTLDDETKAQLRDLISAVVRLAAQLREVKL